MLVQVMKDVIDAHEDAWRKAAIAHCDVSLGNIQILEGRGILADWEFGTPVSQLSTDRAINSGTLDTMPPRLAYHKLVPKFSSPTLSRTIWDEVCSIYLCFISPLIEEDAIQARDSAGLLANLLIRMSMLYEDDTLMLMLWPQYRSNSTVVAAFKSAAVKLLPDPRRGWKSPPGDASSELWWDRLRGILDSFVAG
jgi:hypothetical protein